MKTAWIFQHVPFEGPGAFAPWLLSFGYDVRTFHWWEHASPPDLSDVDVAISMGGPMSVNDTQEFPWLLQEQYWLRSAMEEELPVIGVCLGAQNMAAALGASVKANPEREIGWWPIQDVQNPASNPLPVLHWHGETFEIPEGSVHLEESEGCRNQSFLWGERALGLQYHMEATRESLTSLIENCRHELTPDHFVQTEEEIWAGWEAHHQAATQMLKQRLEQICFK